MMNKTILYRIIAIIILAVGVLSVALIFRNKPEARKQQKKQMTLYVKAQKAVSQNISPTLTYPGRFSSYETVSLAAEVNGRIMEGNVPFKEGEKFKKGDLLIEIYSEDIAASLRAGKSNLLQKLSFVLPDLRIDYPEEYDKWNRFFNSIDVNTNLPPLPAIKTEQEQVFMSSQGVLSEYYSLKSKEINLTKYSIHAPFNGSFKDIQRHVGAVANPGVTLATIVRTDRLEMVVPVPPQNAKWIKQGTLVSIKDSEGNNHKGTVTRVSDFVDELTQTVKIYVKYEPKGQRSFKIGEFSDATFKTIEEVKGVALPREAVLNDNMVYTVVNNKLKLRKVTIERHLEDLLVISGLEEDAMVVTESLVDISEGESVKIKGEETTPNKSDSKATQSDSKATQSNSKTPDSSPEQNQKNNQQ
jgi:multidrug efflux pump subunit AcrA (membrane-fusion protein)